MRAVSLVGVGVHDENSQLGEVRLQITHRDGDIVQHAKSFAAIREGVVRAARQIGRQPAGERGAAGQPGAFHREARAPHQRGSGRQAEHGALLRRELVVFQPPQIIGSVDAQQMRVVARPDLRKFLRRDDAFREQ